MRGPISHLTQHFIENWWTRVGGIPSLQMVRQIVNESVKIQHCKDLLDQRGFACRQLALYWHTGLRIIVTVDHITEMAVSVFTDNMALERNYGKPDSTVERVAPGVAVRGRGVGGVADRQTDHR
jgi:hypothetical protein